MYSIVDERIHVNFRMVHNRFQDVDLFDGYERLIRIYRNAKIPHNSKRQGDYKFLLAVLRLGIDYFIVYDFGCSVTDVIHTLNPEYWIFCF